MVKLLMVATGLSLALGFLAIFFPWLVASLLAGPRTYNVSNAPKMSVAIVFGAGLRRDGTPSPILRDRVATAVDLFFAGKVEKLLMSGDNRFLDYNEPEAMQNYAIQLGVPEEAIVLDYAGHRTYDTCYRAQEIFGVKRAILVTQAFHLPRALYICRVQGLEAMGVPADRREYRQSITMYWTFRELMATLTAFWDVHITRPLPVLGEPEPIFPQELP